MTGPGFAIWRERLSMGRCRDMNTMVLWGNCYVDTTRCMVVIDCSADGSKWERRMRTGLSEQANSHPRRYWRCGKLCVASNLASAYRELGTASNSRQSQRYLGRSGVQIAT